LLKPLRGRTIHQVLDRENGSIDLRGRLHCVAPVDEKSGTIIQHDRCAGRTGKAGKPGQPLLTGRQIFVLLTVGAWHHEAIEPVSFKFGAQCSNTRGTVAAFTRIVE
jgi:hypothetical protein